jgi:hypothetical protein
MPRAPQPGSSHPASPPSRAGSLEVRPQGPEEPGTKPKVLTQTPTRGPERPPGVISGRFGGRAWADFQKKSAREGDSANGSLGRRLRGDFWSFFAVRAQSPTCVSYGKNQCELKVGPLRSDLTRRVGRTRESTRTSTLNRSKIARKSLCERFRSEPRDESLSRRAFLAPRGLETGAEEGPGRAGGVSRSPRGVPRDAPGVPPGSPRAPPGTPWTPLGSPGPPLWRPRGPRGVPGPILGRCWSIRGRFWNDSEAIFVRFRIDSGGDSRAFLRPAGDRHGGSGTTTTNVYLIRK